MKKIVSLFLIAVLTLGMMTVASAAPKTNKIVGVNPYEGTYDFPSDTIEPGTECYLDLTPEIFEWDDPDSVPDELSLAIMKSSKVSVRWTSRSGSRALYETELVRNSVSGSGVSIKVEFIDPFVSVKDLDFDFTIYFVIDGKRTSSDWNWNYVNTLANEITEVHSGDDYVDTSEGQIAEAMEFVQDIEVDLGNGVSIFTKFFKSKKYYGISTREEDEADAVVFAKYPDVDNVVTLSTVGLNSTGDIVKLDTDYSEYYVYDIDMNYLGRSNELLPYSAKYYLANKNLDIAVDDDGIDDEGAPESEDVDDGDGQNPASGGDSIAKIK